MTCLLLLALTYTAVAQGSCQSGRNIPGDNGWPAPAEWTSLNETVGGRLIATPPLAIVCHTEGLGLYDEVACAALKGSGTGQKCSKLGNPLSIP